MSYFETLLRYGYIEDKLLCVGNLHVFGYRGKFQLTRPELTSVTGTFMRSPCVQRNTQF